MCKHDMIYEIQNNFRKFEAIRKKAKNYRLSRKHPIRLVLCLIREAPNDHVTDVIFRTLESSACSKLWCITH